jgi:hypothetical protein
MRGGDEPSLAGRLCAARVMEARDMRCFGMERAAHSLRQLDLDDTGSDAVAPARDASVCSTDKTLMQRSRRAC